MQAFDPDTDQIDAAIALWRFIAARQAIEITELADQGIQDIWRLAAQRVKQRVKVLAKKEQPIAPTRTRNVPVRVSTLVNIATCVLIIYTGGSSSTRSTYPVLKKKVSYSWG